MRKRDYYLCENKDADQLYSNCAFVFATWIVQFLLYIYPKFQDSVCIGRSVSNPVGNPEEQFSPVAAHMLSNTTRKLVVFHSNNGENRHRSAALSLCKLVFVIRATTMQENWSSGFRTRSNLYSLRTKGPMVL